MNHISDNSVSNGSAATYNTQQTVSTIGSLSVGARARRSLDVESQGFKLTHNDEYFCEMATKIMAILTNNPRSSESDVLEMLRQNYSEEVLNLFAKAVIFRMKILKALRAGSLAKERRVDSLTERCYTRLGLANLDTTNILFKSEQQKPTKSLRNTAGVQKSSVDTSGRAPESPFSPEVQSASTAGSTGNRAAKLSLDGIGQRAKWSEISRPASPIRIRNAPPTLTTEQKLHGTFASTDPSAFSPSVPSLASVLNHENFTDRANPMPNLPQGSDMNNGGTAINVPAIRQQQYSQAKFSDLKNQSTSATNHSYVSPRQLHQHHMPSFHSVKSHALADDVESNETESFVRIDDYDGGPGGSWGNGSALRVSDGSAVRMSDGTSTTTPEDLPHKSNRNSYQKSKPSGIDDEEVFVPLQTISFGQKQKRYSRKNNQIAVTTKADQDDSDLFFSTKNGQVEVQQCGNTMNNSSRVRSADFFESAANDTLKHEFMANKLTSVPSASKTEEVLMVNKNDSLQEVPPTSSKGDENSSVRSAPPLLKSCSEEAKKVPFLEAVDLPLAKVVAPADLPEGYAFEARVGHKRFMATVPVGGVTKGETFFTYVRKLDKVEVSVPVGEWRDDLCDCCAFGPFHPLFLNACFCPHVAMGQIMSRSGLDYKGHEAQTFMSRQTCATLFIVIVTYVCLNLMILGLMANDYAAYGDFIPSWQLLICFASLNAIFIAYSYYAICATRASLRSRYMIPERRCKHYEDCCCSLFCTFCTITQMGRHTGDFSTFRGVCCNSTGLPRHVTLPRDPDAACYEQMKEVDVSNVVVI